MEKDNSLIKSIEEVFRSSWDMPALTDWGKDMTYSYGDVATRVCYIHFLLEIYIQIYYSMNINYLHYLLLQ